MSNHSGSYMLNGILHGLVEIGVLKHISAAQKGTICESQFLERLLEHRQIAVASITSRAILAPLETRGKRRIQYKSLKCFRSTEQPYPERYATLIAPRPAARRFRVAGHGPSRKVIATTRPDSIRNRL
jgi:hypothetical protein